METVLDLRLADGGDKRVWDRWELGFFDERESERDYTFSFFRFLVFIFLIGGVVN